MSQKTKEGTVEITEKEIAKAMREYVYSTFVDDENGQKFLQQVINSLDRGLDRYFTKVFDISCCYYNSKDDIKGFHDINEISYEDLWCSFYDNYNAFLKELIKHQTSGYLSIDATVKKYVKNRKIIKDNMEIYNKYNISKQAVKFCKRNSDIIIGKLAEKYTFIYTMTLINNMNKRYKGKLKAYIHYEETCNTIKNGLLTKIPDNYIDFFPLARQMKRKFILHIGGTNSGKTYMAMQALKRSNKGVYLGPLRLLAAEQFYRLNKEGYICDLKTGEEKKEYPDAKYVASTIEMLNFMVHYEVAVIDEAQLISDTFRGGAWTNAILGILADEIHICAAPESESILKRIIVSCGDEYEIQHHERNTPLIVEEEPFEFSKKGIRKGDAFIVFSKRSVHDVANDIRRLGHPVSIIYGALPYDVRQNEAKKFENGITEVLVTTDAIGLGMNLPIRRVVFLETNKFDGRKIRNLDTQEVKQIAGRAGRFNLFSEGYVNSFSKKNMVKKKLYADIPDIENAYIRFPQNLISIDAPLSSILYMWDKMKVNDGFLKTDISHERYLCGIAEKYTDDKNLIYEFITIPFEEDNGSLLNLWKSMIQAKLAGEHIALHTISPLRDGKIDEMGLQELERAYKICDLIYYYNEKFEESIESAYVMEEKEKISNAMIKLLDEHKLPKKKCKYCGKLLPWHFRYNVCEKCHTMNSSYYW